MRLEVRLLGTPTVLRDGAQVPPPRGTKPWALLAYLLLNRPGVSRSRLAGLLFSDAEDPLGALRWNLNALRRLIGDADSFRGDPIEPLLPSGSWVDVSVLRSGSWPDAIQLAGLGRDLLEGVAIGGTPAFDAWLTAERRRVGVDSQAALREAALARLAARDPVGATEAAALLVGIDPLVEGSHELLVRSLMTAGRTVEAAKHLERATELIRRELGVEPGTQLLAAAEAHPRIQRDASHAVEVHAALEAGIASVFAGQASGIETLQRAVAQARGLGDPELLTKALLGLGTASAFTDSVVNEGDAAGLYEAVTLADQLSSARLGAYARRELGFSQYWRAHYERAEVWLTAASEVAQGDPREQGRVWYVRGCILTETAHYTEAIDAFEQSVALLDEERLPQDVAFAHVMLGRAFLLSGALDRADDTLSRALSISRSRWISLAPWAESFLGEVRLVRGEVADAASMFEHAYALACHHYRTNRCQSLSSRGLGLVSAAKGDLDAAIRWFDFARTRGPRGDLHPWFRAYALESLCDVAVQHHLPGAPTWIASLEETAGRHGMRDLLARALVHRGRLGDANAAAAGRTLAAEIDSPRLHEMLD